MTSTAAGSFSSFKKQNEITLKSDYSKYIQDNYNHDEPETFVGYEDFCAYKWDKI